jgi:putative ABC transport system ATP-binding protein
VTDRPLAIEVRGLAVSYGEGRLRQPVLRDLALDVPRGCVLAVTGPSGSGKSTLLSVLGGLERPEAGSVVVAGQDLATLGPRALTRYRREHVGFVFQSFHLLPGLTVVENVEAGLEPLRLARSDLRRRAAEALDAVGLGALHDRFPRELSGGEQQRVGVARALAKDPPLLLADEPTGNLDEASARDVLDRMLAAVERREGRTTVVLVSHDAAVVARASRVVRLREGHLEATR